jgi:uncharacterized membrane protein YfcA
MDLPGHPLILDFSLPALFFSALLFLWAGFVRSGLGFGGAALGLPLMLFIQDQPLFWLPVIGTHLLFFSALTLRKRIHAVDWDYLKQAGVFIIPAALVGVLGLINLPSHLLVFFIYSITLAYALMWLFDLEIRSRRNWTDRVLLVLGGYVAGTSLTGAPLMVAVFMRNVERAQLRNTLFVLWFVLVTIKMVTFLAFSVPLQFSSALLLIPVAAIGHTLGLRAHDYILQNDRVFKRVTGAFLLLVCLLGLAQQLHR